MTRFRSVSLSLHFRFSPAVNLLSVSITAKCQHHVWLIIRLTDEAHIVSAVTLCSFVMMHLKQQDYRWRAKKKRGWYSESSSFHVCVDVKHRGPVIYQPGKWKTLHPVFLPLFTRTGLNVSLTGDRGLCSRVINDQHSPNTLSDVVDVRDARCSPREGVTARVNKTQPKGVRNI